jgi:hypothetical protein
MKPFLGTFVFHNTGLNNKINFILKILKQDKETTTTKIKTLERGSRKRLVRFHHLFLLLHSNDFFLSLLNQMVRNHTKLVSQSKEGHEINEFLGDIEFASTFGSSVIKGECVMIIVITFPYRSIRDKVVLCRLNMMVVGMIAKHVCSRVYEPRRVKGRHVPLEIHNDEAVKEALVPKVPRNKRRTNEGEDEVQVEVVLVLDPNNRVSHQVREVQFFGIQDDLGMLLSHEPTDVSKEEPSIRVVRISIRLTELVMHPVVPTPDKQRVLSCDTLTYTEEDSKRESRTVGLVSPESVSSCSDSHCSCDSDPVTDEPSLGYRVGPIGVEEIEAVNIENCGDTENGNIGPHDIKVTISNVDEGSRRVGENILSLFDSSLRLKLS